MNIAVLLTCFNRKEKTRACLKSMYAALDIYNATHTEDKILLEVFLVDDGCTDGTSDVVRAQFSNQSLHIIQGTGSLYWAGGMRLAWSEAYKRHSEWDFYLLLNDDTELFPESFQELINTHYYCREKYNASGIYSGITCASDNQEKCTYSGSIWVNKFKGTSKLLGESTIPQSCDMTNANILLVSTIVVDKIGRFSEEYQHGLADYDYSIRANMKDIPVLITAKKCGICDNDHENISSIANKVINMSLSERRKYFKNPVHSNNDYLKFIWNTSPIRLPIVWVGRMLNIYFPRLYYKLNGKR